MQDHVVFVFSWCDYHAPIELGRYINCLYEVIAFFAVKFKHTRFSGLDAVSKDRSFHPEGALASRMQHGATTLRGGYY